MEATLDDMWQLDLVKLDQWVCLKQSEVLWSGRENDSDIDEDAEGEDLSESDLEGEEEGEEPEPVPQEEEEVEYIIERPQTDAAMVSGFCSLKHEIV